MQLLRSNWLGQGSRGSASMARNQNRPGRRAVFVQKHSTQQWEVTCLPDTFAYQAALGTQAGQITKCGKSRISLGW